MSVADALRALRSFLDAIQLIAPMALEPAGPLVERPERVGVDAIQHVSPLAPGVDQPDIAEHAQVFRYRGLREFERVDDLAHRPFVAGEEIQDRPALRLGNGVEHIRTGSGPRHVLMIFLYGNMSSGQDTSRVRRGVVRSSARDYFT